MPLHRPRIELPAHEAAYLERARTLARKGWGQVHPNPMVGCVLVLGDVVVGEGYHAVFGGPHAEIVALEQALTRAKGSTAYVTLEPCNHHGKTPPCAEALRSAGVARVVFGAPDPGRESGGGAAALAEAGIEVVGPVWDEQEARAEFPALYLAAEHERPFVTLKLAMSLDGKIASSPGEETRITGIDVQQEVHRLRTGFDAVMVGAGTVRADDPQLTPRLVAGGRTPTRRILLMPAADLAPEASVLRDAAEHPVHVFCLDSTPEATLERLESQGVHVHPVAAEREGARWLDLTAVFIACHELGISSIFCEGGAALAGSLLRDDLVDRMHLFIAPRALGTAALSAFPPGAESLGWERFAMVHAPLAYGSDTLITLDRVVA